MLRNALAPALAVLARELDLGPVPLESHGPSTQTVLGGWLVVRDGCIDDDCIDELHARVNARIAQIADKTRRIGDLVYACSRLARCS
jgi:hypothetical protein